MSKTDSNEHRVPFIPDVDPKYPLLHPVIARHLGLYSFKVREAEENLRRARKVFDTFAGLGVTLFVHADTGQPFTSEDITPELIAQHKDMITNERIFSTEEFEENLLNVISSHTGVPRVSYIRISRGVALRTDRPYAIVQEVDDQYHAERRRVEHYADGRLLWRRDGYHGEGTAEEEFTESEYVPGLSILNDRDGQRAEVIPAEEFEELWDLATREKCLWIIAPGLSGATDTRCPLGRPDDAAFCDYHKDAARRMFPPLFENA